ncbi:MAG: hypothetical protein WCJ19_02430 [bacterium]
MAANSTGTYQISSKATYSQYNPGQRISLPRQLHIAELTLTSVQPTVGILSRSGDELSVISKTDRCTQDTGVYITATSRGLLEITPTSSFYQICGAIHGGDVNNLFNNTDGIDLIKDLALPRGLEVNKTAFCFQLGGLLVALINPPKSNPVFSLYAQPHLILQRV